MGNIKALFKNIYISVFLFVFSALLAYFSIFINALIAQKSLQETSGFDVFIQKTLYCNDFRYISVSLMLTLLIERFLISIKKKTLAIKIFDFMEMFWTIIAFLIWVLLLNNNICYTLEKWGLNIVVFDCICLGITLLMGIFIIILKCISSN